MVRSSEKQAGDKLCTKCHCLKFGNIVLNESILYLLVSMCYSSFVTSLVEVMFLGCYLFVLAVAIKDVLKWL